ncbi:MAG: phosphatidate cytidylyltransferase [FCB group bacterium]|jgi:phosphatidate cytidylyltransferase|nr:phosphatidate cytidylyltransferase [FCB group bacterium]
MSDKKKHGLLLRLVTASVLLPTVFVLIWVPSLHWGFSIFVAALAAVGLYEFYALVRRAGYSPETIGGILGGTVVALSGHFGSVFLTTGLLYGAALMVSALHIVRGQRSVAGLAASAFGVFYVGWFGAHLSLLRSSVNGPGLVTTLFVIVVLTDTAAYFVGSRFGKHKMAPAISPNKSWEGALGGVAFSILGMMIVYWLRQRWGWTALPDWSIYRCLVAGLALSAAAQIGDFAESALKRDAGVKDSGAIFPGHGGVLDRCDGFLYAAPFLYYIALTWITIP